MKIIKGHLIAGSEKIYIQRGYTIYRINDESEEKLFNIDAPLWKRILIKIRLCQRLLRTDIRAAIVCDNKLFYALSGCLHSYDLLNHQHKKELVFRSGMRTPLGMTYIKGINSFDDQLCFGEYFSNKDREEVNIWSNRKDKWEVVYSFPANTIRHIHGIVADQYRNCVYIMTGDEDEESIIWKAENDFRNVKKYIWGDQSSRCCILQPRKDCIVYATDSEYKQNQVYMVNIKEGDQVERKAICNLEGSVIHGYALEEGKLYFATTVEPNKGGIQTDKSVVYELDASLELREIISDKKDIFSPMYFQYGFANVTKSSRALWVSYTATKKYDGRTVVIDE